MSSLLRSLSLHSAQFSLPYKDCMSFVFIRIVSLKMASIRNALSAILGGCLRHDSFRFSIKKLLFFPLDVKLLFGFWFSSSNAQGFLFGYREKRLRFLFFFPGSKLSRMPIWIMIVFSRKFDTRTLLSENDFNIGSLKQCFYDVLHVHIIAEKLYPQIRNVFIDFL